jgi:hypothetical protein
MSIADFGNVEAIMSRAGIASRPVESIELDSADALSAAIRKSPDQPFVVRGTAL